MSAENRRILIIDDERPILMTLAALLGRHGYEPEVAANASAGIRLLEGKKPALVLLDLQLPDADGLHMLEQIKASHPDTQVIILTAHDSLITRSSPSNAAPIILSANLMRRRNCSAWWRRRSKSRITSPRNNRAAGNDTAFEKKIGAGGDPACSGFQQQGHAGSR